METTTGDTSNDNNSDTNKDIEGVINLDWLPDNAYIDETTLAKAFHKTTRTVRRMVVRREIPPPFSLGGKRQWRGGDVKDWIDGLAEKAQKAREIEETERAKIRAKQRML